MNFNVGNPKRSSSRYWYYLKTTEMVNPRPSGIFVLTDEREDSINNCIFGVDMTGYNPATPNNPRAVLIDWPGCYHNGAGTFQFADGHVENHKWRDPRTTSPLDHKNPPTNNGTQMPNSLDIYWLQKHAAGLVY